MGVVGVVRPPVRGDATDPRRARGGPSRTPARPARPCRRWCRPGSGRCAAGGPTGPPGSPSAGRRRPWPAGAGSAAAGPGAHRRRSSASAWTRQMARSGPNHRGPSDSNSSRAWSAPSGRPRGPRMASATSWRTCSTPPSCRPPRRGSATGRPDLGRGSPVARALPSTLGGWPKNPRRSPLPALPWTRSGPKIRPPHRGSTRRRRPPPCRGGCCGPSPIFWLGFIATLVGRWLFSRLHTLLFLIVVSFFLSLAIEPGVNFLARRGWRRGVATALFLFGITLAALLFVGAIGALIGRQVANFIDDLPARITEVQDFVNRNFSTELDFGELIDRIDKAQLAGSLANNTISFTTTVLGGLLQVLTVAPADLLHGGRRPAHAAGHLPPDATGPPGAGPARAGSWPSTRPAATSTRGLCSPCCRRCSTRPRSRDRAAVPRGPRHLGRPGVAVPARHRHLPGRRAAGAGGPARRADPGAVGAHRHRHLPADRELPPRPPHHGADAGAAPRRRLLGGHRRRRDAGPGRRHPRPARLRDGAGVPQPSGGPGTTSSTPV